MFKIGDRVRILPSARDCNVKEEYIGKEATITTVFYDNDYAIMTEDGYYSSVCEIDIELILREPIQMTPEEALETIGFQEINYVLEDLKTVCPNEYKTVEQAVAELAKIKQRAEERRNDGNTLLREIELIDYIIEGVKS